MNRRLFYFFALMGAWWRVGVAQAQPQPYRFDLQAEKLDVPAGPWQVVRVLDLRADRSRLGTVHRGLDNLLAPADFTQPLAAEVLQFLRAKLPAGPDARPVLLRVFALAVGEDLRMSSENAEAELVADFLEPQPDSTFRVLLAVGETTRRGGLDVTKFHPANVALMLQQALQKLAALPAAPAPTPAETLSRADVLAGRGGAAARRFAIQEATPARGFYRSFQEFRDNAPSAPAYPFAITHVAHAGKRWAGTEEVQVNYLQTDDRHLARPVSTADLWGLSDGAETLLVYRNRFYQLLPAADGRSYTFIGPPLFNAPAMSNVVGAALIGGMVGAAVMGTGKSSGSMAPYELHLATGRVVPAQETNPTGADGFSAAPATAYVYVYRRPDAAKGTPVIFSATGQPAVDLPARHFVALTWQDRNRELQLCAQAGAGAPTCQGLVPDFAQPTYFECTVPPGGGAPVLRPVPAKEGAAEVRRMQSATRMDASDK